MVYENVSLSFLNTKYFNVELEQTVKSTYNYRIFQYT